MQASTAFSSRPLGPAPVKPGRDYTQQSCLRGLVAHPSGKSAISITHAISQGNKESLEIESSDPSKHAVSLAFLPASTRVLNSETDVILAVVFARHETTPTESSVNIYRIPVDLSQAVPLASTLLPFNSRGALWHSDLPLLCVYGSETTLLSMHSSDDATQIQRHEAIDFNQHHDQAVETASWNTLLQNPGTDWETCERTEEVELLLSSHGQSNLYSWQVRVNDLVPITSTVHRRRILFAGPAFSAILPARLDEHGTTWLAATSAPITLNVGSDKEPVPQVESHVMSNPAQLLRRHKENQLADTSLLHDDEEKGVIEIKPQPQPTLSLSLDLQRPGSGPSIMQSLFNINALNNLAATQSTYASLCLFTTTREGVEQEADTPHTSMRTIQFAASNACGRHRQPTLFALGSSLSAEVQVYQLTDANKLEQVESFGLGGSRLFGLMFHETASDARGHGQTLLALTGDPQEDHAVFRGAFTHVDMSICSVFLCENNVSGEESKALPASDAPPAGDGDEASAAQLNGSLAQSVMSLRTHIDSKLDQMTSRFEALFTQLDQRMARLEQAIIKP